MSGRRGRPKRRAGRVPTKRTVQSGGDPRAALSEAFAAHREGRLDQAERLYRQAVTALPDNPDAHYLYGLLDHHRGDHETALRRFDRALELRPDHAACQSQRAEALAALGRLDEAEAALRTLLETEPGSPQILNNLGNVLADSGRLGASVEAYRKAAEVAPDFVDPHANLGAVLARLGELEAARGACAQALALVPEHGQALVNMGGILAELGRDQEAALHLERAFGLIPENPRLRVELASALISIGKIAEAADHLGAVLDAEEPGEDAWTAATKLLAAADGGENHRALETILARCLLSDHVAPEEIATPAARMVRRRHDLPGDPCEAARMEFGDDLLDRLNDDDIACGMLARCVNTDAAFEIVLTRLRARILDREATAQSDRFAAALSMQCFLNEYVFEVTEGEAAGAAALGRSIEQSSGRDGFPDEADCQDLLRYSLFASLSSLACATVLEALPLKGWPQYLRAIARAQLTDWIAERGIAVDLPVIGTISDKISQEVAAQYEDNPYPRWNAAPTGLPESAAQVFARLFPRSAIPNVLGGPLNIMVAGCGTGRHPIASVACRYEDCQVLAVDLSRTSLAFATRMARDMDVRNIEFAQADILGLGELDQRFHLIECAGVLHHMADPLQGWRMLRDLLVPGGVMIIGLYSERARAGVVAAREQIAALKLSGSRNSIRTYRHRILFGEEGEALNALLEWPDFYSTSGCRDLLFHVQEHRFTLQQITKALSELGLELIGFENDDPAFWRRYREHAPHDPAGVDLAAWDHLEADYPNLFAGMYQFWCRRTDG